MTFQGQYIDELKQSLGDSVEDYLLKCKKIENKPEIHSHGRFNIRISPELHQKIARKAAEAGVSLNS